MIRFGAGESSDAATTAARSTPPLSFLKLT
jgi:hypothetical protein